MLTQDRLMELLSYDASTGIFAWRVTLHGRGGAVKAGKIAGSRDSKGKLQIKIDGRIFFAHRLAFLYMTGKWPDVHVDHINRDSQDNRWSNLREATVEQNMTNRMFKKRSLPQGVYTHTNGRVTAAIWVKGRLLYLGIFSDAEKASLVYQEALKKRVDERFLPK